MRIIIFGLVICSLTTFGQNGVSNLASLHQQEYLQYVTSNGTKDFYVLEKVCYGSVYRGKNAS